MASKFLVSSMLLLAVSPGAFSETPEDPETVIRCQAGIDDPVGPFDFKFRFTDADDDHVPFDFTLRYGPNSHTAIPFNGTVDSEGHLYFDEDGSFYGVDLEFSAEFDYHLSHHWEVADEAHFTVDELFDLLGFLELIDLDLGCLDFSKYCHVSEGSLALKEHDSNTEDLDLFALDLCGVELICDDSSKACRASDGSLTPRGPEVPDLTRLNLECEKPWKNCHFTPRSLTRTKRDSASQSLCLTPRGAVLCMAERARRGNSSQ
ncbi:hypothetical protein FALBO_8679 [Fusarium albosuccineum]|uniref:Uncharacterized protein n=1 Tax=Fusarium albosuccineum TaxID=1237068 RepID=A0A8H4P6P6_9HYPO|nr:hypothetical protein FALBO_8679 [Fusarium albosuccineum]